MIERLKQVEAALRDAHQMCRDDAADNTLPPCAGCAALDALSVQCPRCKGEGEVLDNETRVRLGGPMARVSPLVKCSLCDGTGRVMMRRYVEALEVCDRWQSYPNAYDIRERAQRGETLTMWAERKSELLAAFREETT